MWAKLGCGLLKALSPWTPITSRPPEVGFLCEHHPHDIEDPPTSTGTNVPLLCHSILLAGFIARSWAGEDHKMEACNKSGNE